MTVYRRGAAGPEVVQIQTRLTEHGFYSGAIDGSFGGGTESAVRAFQRSQQLPEDGVVGASTWRALDGGEIPVPAIVTAALPLRCLALTAAFETGAPPPDCFATVTGDFDGMGISFGALQWNLGTHTLQDLLNDVNTKSPSTIDDVFHEHAAELRTVLGEPLHEQLTWARSIQDPATHRLNEPWRGLFRALGRTQACLDAQQREAESRYRTGLTLCGKYGLWSERAAAFMFDIAVQNGSISAIVDQQIQSDLGALSPASPDRIEVSKMEIIALRRSAASKPAWVEDVRSRKLTIARGAGSVHGRAFDLEQDFGIRLVARDGLLVGGALGVSSPASTPGVH